MSKTTIKTEDYEVTAENPLDALGVVLCLEEENTREETEEPDQDPDRR